MIRDETNRRDDHGFCERVNLNARDETHSRRNRDKMNVRFRTMTKLTAAAVMGAVAEGLLLIILIQLPHDECWYFSDRIALIADISLVDMSGTYFRSDPMRARMITRIASETGLISLYGAGDWSFASAQHRDGRRHYHRWIHPRHFKRRSRAVL